MSCEIQIFLEISCTVPGRHDVHTFSDLFIAEKEALKLKLNFKAAKLVDLSIDLKKNEGEIMHINSFV